MRKGLGLDISKILQKGFIGAILLSAFSFADAIDDKYDELDKDLLGLKDYSSKYIVRSDAIPDSLEDSNDTYLEGYIQALINAHYYEFDIFVMVQERKVYLYNLPSNKLFAKSIVSFVEDVKGVDSVQVISELTPSEMEEYKRRDKEEKVGGIWFPQSTVLFQPLVADPRETNYSAEYRYGDRVIGKQVVAVSLGDCFPIFRWKHVLPWKGDMQVGIQAGIWSLFCMGREECNGEIAQLVNTDYFVGIPVDYASGKWAFRFRVYHISSHLGDEYLVDNPDVKRVNPSFEAFDVTTSCQITPGIRLYFGPGFVFHSDHSYYINPLYVQYGAELRMFGHKNHYHGLFGTPFLAINFRNWQAVHWRLDGSGMIGYEWSKLQGIGRKMRLFLEYHNGYSEGQFFKETTSWGSAGFSWGF